MKMNYETVMAYGGLAGASFDIAAGPANTAVIDVLLSVGAGALTEDAPLVLTSTGALGGARALDISGMEVESAGKGGLAIDGRIFILSVQNSDIATNNITVSSSATINGAASLVIGTTGDYLFTHVSSGAWLANILPRPSESLATIARVSFASTVWDAGATKNTIKILQTGVPAAGEVGPHGLTVASSYVVQVINTDATPDEMVDVETQFDSSGNIILKKSGLGADFAGVAIIVGSLD